MPNKFLSEVANSFSLVPNKSLREVANRFSLESDSRTLLEASSHSELRVPAFSVKIGYQI